MTTYDDTVAEARSRPVIWLLYLNAATWAALGVLTAVVLADMERHFGFAAASGAIFQSFMGTFVLLFVTAVLWLWWFKVVAQRTELTKRARLRGSWWFWGWAIPGVYLVLPKMMVNDIWHASDPLGREEPMPLAIQWWWGLWVATPLANLVSRRFDADWEPQWFDVAVYLVLVVSMVAQALLAVRVVRALTARDKLLGPRPAPHPEFVPEGWPATTP